MPSVWPPRSLKETPSTALMWETVRRKKPLLHGEPDLEVLGFQDHRRLHVDLRRLALWLRFQQLLGVRMLGRGENFLGRAALHDLAVLHHAGAVRHLAHDAEIVRDEQHRHMQLALQVLQKVEDLRLDRHVERGRRLVGDEQIGLVRERHGDHHALALAARKLVRVGGKPVLRVADADFLQKLQRPLPRRAVRHAAMDFQDLAHLHLDRMQRIERGHRLLENDGDAVAANVPDLGFRGAQQVLAFKKDLARGVMRARRQQSQDRKRGDRLAGARLAHKRNRFAFLNVERNIAYRKHARRRGWKADA